MIETVELLLANQHWIQNHSVHKIVYLITEIVANLYWNRY